MTILQLRRFQKKDADLDAVAASGVAAAWTAYTPTITAGTGSFTTVSATGRYLAIGKLVLVQIVITITTNGTAATSVKATLPALGNVASGYTMYGRANTVSGKALQGIVNFATALATIFNYDNTYPGASGETITMNGFYEVV